MRWLMHLVCNQKSEGSIPFFSTMKKEFKVLYALGSGPGGQHKNRTYSCVTVIHIPTGLQEVCQETRSKIKNEKLATERLLKKLEKLREKEKHEQVNELRKKVIKDSKRVRTYNYKTNIVTDHRTGKRANLKKVLDGNLDLLK